MNTEIIQDGVNGFLAKDEKQWGEKALRVKELGSLELWSLGKTPCVPLVRGR
jgi:hypothetical protein